MTDTKRRTVTKLLGLGTVYFVPFATVASLLPKASLAATIVDPASENAQALNYTDTSETEGAACRVCALYQSDQAETGSCPLFPEQEVKATGLCSAFVLKQ